MKNKYSNHIHSPPKQQTDKKNCHINIKTITMKQISIILIFSFLFTACKKNKVSYDTPCTQPTNDITISNQLITGNWTWVSEYYVQPFTGNIFYKTPQTEGFTRQLNVNNSVIEFIKNNILEQKYRFEIVNEKSITNNTNDVLNVLVYNDYNTGQRTNYVHFTICNDTLTLNFQVRSDLVGKEKWVKK